jgi:hypothetical protein
MLLPSDMDVQLLILGAIESLNTSFRLNKPKQVQQKVHSHQGRWHISQFTGPTIRYYLY